MIKVIKNRKTRKVDVFKMGVFEGLGCWALGEWPEMGRDLGTQSMARIGAIWKSFDLFNFNSYYFLYFCAIDSVIHLFDRQRHIYRTTRLEKLVTLIWKLVFEDEFSKHNFVKRWFSIGFYSFWVLSRPPFFLLIF